jgi:hypothetical protein
MVLEIWSLCSKFTYFLHSVQETIFHRAMLGLCRRNECQLRWESHEFLCTMKEATWSLSFDSTIMPRGGYIPITSNREMEFIQNVVIFCSSGIIFLYGMVDKKSQSLFFPQPSLFPCFQNDIMSCNAIFRLSIIMVFFIDMILQRCIYEGLPWKQFKSNSSQIWVLTCSFYCNFSQNNNLRGLWN